MKTKFWLQAIPAVNESPVRILIDSVELSPIPSQQLRNHSPDGFEYGYSGSGPAQAALAICLHLLEDAEQAQAVYQFFKERYITPLPMGKPVLQEIDWTDFLLDNAERLEEARQHIGESDELAGDDLLSQAELILYGVPATDGTSPGKDPRVERKLSAYKAGDWVRINASFCDEQPAGEVGLVYEVDSQQIVSILTRRGVDLGGFDLIEQSTYLSYVGKATGYTYTFRSISWLMTDYHQGRLRSFLPPNDLH